MHSRARQGMASNGGRLTSLGTL
ncbi:hypothetical protein LINPERHAP2_LOCUS32436 [Linum perenne]